MTRSLAVLAAAAGLLLLTGCSSLTDDEKSRLCIALGLGGYDYAVTRAQDFVPVSDAADALREAVKDHCPQHLDNIPAGS